jgi:hypothetical protein
MPCILVYTQQNFATISPHVNIFDTLISISVKIRVFWDLMQCSLMDKLRRFERIR